MDTERILEEIKDLKNLVAEMNRFRFADQFLTPAELAKLLGVSRKTVTSWRNQAILPYAKFGNKVFFRLRDIEAAFDTKFYRKGTRSKKSQPVSRPKIKGASGNGWEIRVNGNYEEVKAAH